MTTNSEATPSPVGETEPQAPPELELNGALDVENVTPLLYRVDEAADALRLSRSLIYELIRSGRLRSVKAGRRRLVPVAALAEYVDSLGKSA